MFGVKYDTWKNVCNMYFSLQKGSLKSCLQWFPFTKLTKADKDFLLSEDFYNKYIKTGSFVLFSPLMHQSDNFLQKGDGSFRDSSLVGPILYLMLQAIGKEIYDKYESIRPSNVSVYYSGNYKYMRPRYKQDYDDFFKELNSSIDEYQYFIKTDITNFFSNISVDKLIAQIDKICNSNGCSFSQTQLRLFKELLVYCGNGRFPLIENSISSSFLATVVYLDAIDTLLHRYISSHITDISHFRMVRYVDDMYILISSDKPIEDLHEAYNNIRNEYSSILKDYRLSLNSKKCCFQETKKINHELKKSLYDEYFNNKKHNIEELFSGALQKFLRDLSNELLLDSIDVERYNELINKHFFSGDIEFSPSEVFNYYIYENETELQLKSVVDEIVDLVKKSISFINLDPKRLTIMIMKTKNDCAIKGFLNHLFKRNRADKWNSYDTTIAISYLIQSKFQFIDLLKVLSDRNPKLYSYYFNNCKESFINIFAIRRVKKLSEIVISDSKAHYLYFMYLCEIKRKNYLTAFAYFKNFFDRVTADMAFVFKPEPNSKKPNYKGFYKERELISFYTNIQNSETTIKEAHKLRNANPLSHSSSELLDNNDTSKRLKENINNLSKLIYEYVDSHMN